MTEENQDIDCLNKIIDSYSKKIVDENDLSRKTSYISIVKSAVGMKLMIQKNDVR